MKFKDDTFFKIIRSFLTTYLPKQKCYSFNTIKSYKETLNLLIDYLQDEKQIPITQISFEYLDNITICSYLDWLQETRGCSISTRNQRLMVLRSFFKYAGMVDSSYIILQSEVSKVPVKKCTSTIVEYMSEKALQALLQQPLNSKYGIRDRFFMILMYDTAARCGEMLNLKVKDIQVQPKSSIVQLTGKGSKTRLVPIMDKTVEHFRYYLDKFHPIEIRKNDDYLFYTIIHGIKNQMSPDNVASFMNRYGKLAKQSCDEVPNKVHPHQLRHTRAIHLYRGGMPLPLLSEFLGHSDVNTTRIYAYADTEMKRLAIQKITMKNDTLPLEQPVWENNDNLIRKLYGLR
ncbi:tyrosine-type recombinase/integrase [Clostridium guangxiense]|uniref:tyrosine-type recombinase/integrase n=1 Tax=Clostridium guangxiense TaxID=1662055 RepID=UPI001E42927A|nr:tyrosine-type recombinase/integrase [Clostridium guangxiense]MCD2346146.1 site-specific integrase [Clostridium guangxiense]